ncbi:RDD family protein [Streptomyces sp. NRRL S-1521]|uniref:RDD family protein n=1 Tax=Streptomyces sp. NRRL S-1521 TaxID=1609100 RepID=UPI0007471AFF|nr:RDD family protein [Streptomyces sp. NRRL S-1521]KUL54727.1 RDD family protein [Streptomyces sp. NRRL S-1521]
MADRQRTLARPTAAAPTHMRRAAAASVDAVLALLCGLAAGAVAGVRVSDGVAELDPKSPALWGALLGAAFGLSFLNHVLLTLATRASLGKLLTGLRVARASDGGRPTFLRLIGRWLFGFYWMIVFVPIHLAADSGVDQQDAVGVRVVRRGGSVPAPAAHA